MKRIIYFLLSFAIITLWSSCRNDLEFSSSTENLEFSKDTVYLDTVFTNIGSSTYNLKVYNPTNKNISIPSISLERGENSGYRLNVDGIAGKHFENVELLAKDSMFIFVETTIDYDNFSNPDGTYLYTDKIQFNNGTTTQTVDLVTLVKDAVFIYPDKDNTTGIIETLVLNINGEMVETEIQGRYLQSNELTFTNQKPYVIYGYAAVPKNKILTVDAGARVHFHANSGLLVSPNASLHVNGAFSNDQELLENEVIFESDRLEPIFSDIPGQWGTIWLFEGSTNNTITYATIKNATIGVLSEGNADQNNHKLTITNTQIYNTSAFGIYGLNTSIKAENVVINNAGQSALAATLGGKYNFTHCTIANYWDTSFRQFPALLINNFFIKEETTFLANLTEANFNNCIIYGNEASELLIDEVEDDALTFNFKFTNCLLRFDTDNISNEANYNFDDVTHYENIIFNETPNFKEPFNNKLIIGNNSSANNKGKSIFANQVPFDILNVNRTNSPDLGAYQHTTFEEEN